MVGFCALVAFQLVHASLAIQGVDGRIHHPIQEANHHPALLIFISHDCPICNAYAPEMERIRSKYAKDISFNLIYSEGRLKPKDAKEHARAFSLDRFHLLVDPNSKAADACGATVTPQALLFDTNGKVVYSGRIDDKYLALGKQKSQADSHDLRDAIEAVIHHQKPKLSRTTPVGCYIARPYTQ